MTRSRSQAPNPPFGPLAPVEEGPVLYSEPHFALLPGRQESSDRSYLTLCRHRQAMRSSLSRTRREPTLTLQLRPSLSESLASPTDEDSSLGEVTATD